VAYYSFNNHHHHHHQSLFVLTLAKEKITISMKILKIKIRVLAA